MVSDNKIILTVYVHYTDDYLKMSELMFVKLLETDTSGLSDEASSHLHSDIQFTGHLLLTAFRTWRFWWSGLNLISALRSALMTDSNVEMLVSNQSLYLLSITRDCSIVDGVPKTVPSVFYAQWCDIEISTRLRTTDFYLNRLSCKFSTGIFSLNGRNS